VFSRSSNWCYFCNEIHLIDMFDIIRIWYYVQGLWLHLCFVYRETYKLLLSTQLGPVLSSPFFVACCCLKTWKWTKKTHLVGFLRNPEFLKQCIIVFLHSCYKTDFDRLCQFLCILCVPREGGAERNRGIGGWNRKGRRERGEGKGEDSEERGNKGHWREKRIEAGGNLWPIFILDLGGG